MTEKRFYYTGDGINRFSGVIDYDTELSVEETCGILNELEEENKKLKLKNKRIEKQKDDWSFIADCSVQVLNEEDEVKEDYLKVATNTLYELQEENDELKIILADILLGVKRDNYFKTGEITVSINPDSYDMISDVLQKYGALKEWYE